MSESIPELLKRLEAWVGQWPSAIVSYSGGVDSCAGPGGRASPARAGAVACLAASPSLPARERRAAVELAQSMGAVCRVIEASEQHDAQYAANPVNRCYFCKRHWYERIRELADREGWHVILDGTNADDLGEERAGRLAAQEFSVRSPLAEVGVTKAQVRELARYLHLPVWDKPSMACLASRIPTGTPITAELLHQIERAEEVLAGLGLRQFRVRHHGELARIEIPLEDFAVAVACRESLVDGVRAVGYRYVCLDLAGFRGTKPQASEPLGLAMRDKLVP